MKKLLLILLCLPLLFSCGSSTVKIGNLEVMSEDLGMMNWYEAKKACKNLGDGWRLPTKDELNLMWTNLADSDGDGVSNGVTDPNNLGGFAVKYYWSSAEAGSSSAWVQYFGDGMQINYNKDFNYNVRAVRAF